LSKKRYLNCSVLVGFISRFELEFTSELN